MLPTFLIIEPDPIVSIDLVEIIKENIIDPIINVVRSLDEASAQMDERHSPTFPLIDAPLARFENSEIFQKMFSCGTRMMFLDASLDDLAQTNQGFVFVAQPFSTTMIVHALGQLGIASTATDTAPKKPR